jgi:hypothetical protein
VGSDSSGSGIANRFIDNGVVVSWASLVAGGLLAMH